MHLIVYISKIAENTEDPQAVVRNIVESAKQHNKSVNITGVLFYENGYFLQALEGEKDVLVHTFEKISKDSRHNQIIKIIDEPIAARSFADWSLDTFYIDSPALINPDTIVSFKELYEQCFEMDSKKLMDFIKQMVDELDTFKILHED